MNPYNKRAKAQEQTVFISYLLLLEAKKHSKSIGNTAKKDTTNIKPTYKMFSFTVALMPTGKDFESKFVCCHYIAEPRAVEMS